MIQQTTLFFGTDTIFELAVTEAERQANEFLEGISSERLVGEEK